MKQFLVAAAILTSFGTAVLHASDAHGDTQDKWRPCVAEDGSGQTRCVWDAQSRGNGEGQSFFKNRKGIHYITHERAVHMLAR